MQLEIVFINEKGQKYVWRPKTAREDLTTAAADRLAAAVAAIEIGRPEEDNPWKTKGHARFVETPPRDKKKQKRTRKKAAAGTSKKKQERAWVFTPAEVERLKYETLVGRLKALMTKEGAVDTYLMYFRMMKTIYTSKELTLDRKIDPRDFAYDLAKIFSYKGKWSEQMIAAFSELKCYLQKQDFLRCSKQWSAQKKSRDQLLKKQAVAEGTTTDEANEDMEDNKETTEITENENKTKNKSKKVKKYLHNAKKTGKKKPRNNFFF